jgi:hypothetical protein
MFSNDVRKEAEIANLSFTQIARIVGDRWQNLTLSSKEVYENRAQREKEKYNQQLSTYKTTESYRAYQAYLADFKAQLNNVAVQITDPRPPLRYEDTVKGTGTVVNSREVFDAGYSAHRQEEEAERRAENPAAQRAFRERKEKHLNDLKTKVEDLEKAFQSPFGERNTTKEKHLKDLKKELEALEKKYQHAQPGSIVPHYTISRDFSGCNNDVATSILSYLGEREKRRGDLSVLVRR